MHLSCLPEGLLARQLTYQCVYMYMPTYKRLTSYGKDNLMETVVYVTCEEVLLPSI